MRTCFIRMSILVISMLCLYTGFVHLARIHSPVFYLLNCSEQQVKDAMEQLKELVHSELHKYAEDLVGKVASVS